MKISIATKINLIAALVITVSSIFLGWFFVKHETKAIKTELDERAETIVNNLAYNAEYGVLVGDKEDLNRLIQGIVKEKDIAYAIIQNQYGEILAEAGERKTRFIKEFSFDIKAQPLSIENGELGVIPEISGKNKEETIGRVELGVSLDDLNQKTSQLKKVIFTVIIIVITVTTIFMFFAIKLSIVTPLKTLISGTERISRGDLSHRVHIKNNDEIGVLANSFNEMTSALRRDISRRKKIEKKKSEILSQLKVANQELEDFAYIISHDLKAPLRAIGSLANWLSTDYTDKLDEEGRELLSLLLGRVNRMHDLIEGVLKYSRVGRVREDRKKVDLNELVAEVIDMIAPSDNIEIVVVDKLPTVTGEKTRLIQIFQNLIENSVKYMDKPVGKIKVTCKNDNDFWSFSIIDNGPGIDEKHFKKIFQIFQTLSPRDDFESTGIGLSLVKKIVEMYGGEIIVKSEVGAGSTFTFTLPKKKLYAKYKRKPPIPDFA